MPPGTSYLGVTGKACTHGQPKLVFKEPFPVWAGAAQDHCPIPKGALMVDLADLYSSGITAYGGIELPPALQLPRVHLDWPDMGKPFLSLEEWKIFLMWVAEKYSEKGIFIACQAGHGRTGTALSIIGTLLGAIPEEYDPVEWVRAAYCKEAVESQAQVTYLEDVLGIKTKAKPTLGGSWGTKPCNLTIQGTLCKHDCYGTSPEHKEHWCRICKWDWKLVTNIDKGVVTTRLIEKPSPEKASEYEPGHFFIIDPAPPLETKLVEPPKQGEPVKSAEESAQTFLAHGSKPMGPSTGLTGLPSGKVCGQTAKAHELEGECIHMCDRPYQHSGSHACEFCNKRFGGNTMECGFKWDNQEGCMDHICDYGWGHEMDHSCAFCTMTAPVGWDDV